MPKAPDNKKYAREFTIRFLQEMDRILGAREGKKEKVTASEFSETVGTSSSNLTRLRSSPTNYATIDMGCKMCDKYGTSPAWLFMGKPGTDPDQKSRVEHDMIEVMIQEIEKRLNAHQKLISSAINQISKDSRKRIGNNERPERTTEKGYRRN